jgi:periplasmic protein TonB
VFGPSDMIPDCCRFSADQIIAAFVALILHIAILWGLSLHRLAIEPKVSSTVSVKLIALPSLEKTQPPDIKQQEPSPSPEKPKAVPPSKVSPVVTPPVVIPPVATSPLSRSPYKVITPATQVKVSQQVEQKSTIPAAEVAPMPVPLPVGPVALSSELAVICSNRPSPVYPERSKRLRETGTVVIKVLLNLDGRVESSHLEQSSGFPRLDNAALSAVNGWQCSAPLRDGRPVRAIAFQPFNFGLKK